MTHPDINLGKVAQFIADVADRDVMPAFQNLSPDQVYEKQAGEIVTEVDVTAERHLAALLTGYLPGSHVLGEESFEDDPSLMDLCMSDEPVWIIDPIDGTQNFSRGNPHFAMMVTYRQARETQAAWIYDPVNELMYSAAKGKGAQFNGRPITRCASDHALDQQTGSLGSRLNKAHRAAIEQGITGLPKTRDRLRCCGQEYLSLVRNEIQFLQYGVRLKPWDHAPGVLIAAETGCYAAFLADETTYDASRGIADGYLMIAQNRESWLGLRQALWDIHT